MALTLIQEPQKAFIYTLDCPVTGIPKYIGQTINLKQRYKAHCSDIHSKTKKSKWIKSLRNKSLKPTMTVIDEIPRLEVEFWEIHHICLYKSWGFNLKNGTLGGLSTVGYKHTDEAKQKIRYSNQNRVRKPHTDEAKLKMSLFKKGQIPWNKGKKLSQLHIENLKASHKNMSEETKLKMSIAAKNKPKVTEETKLKLREIQLNRRINKNKLK